MSSPSTEASPGASTRTVCIVGNPNAGKTSLFNALTGSQQKVGNYPGVTVERVEGLLHLGDVRVRCVDVPGLYSLEPVSEDERVAVDALEADAPDLVVCVVDASNLERNLFLFTQVAQLGRPTLVALTMVDRVDTAGRRLDIERLKSLLGVPVIPVNGHRESGIDDLRRGIVEAISHPETVAFEIDLPGPVETRIAALREQLARVGADYSRAQVRRAVLGDPEETRRLLEAFPDLAEAFEEARTVVQESASESVQARYRWAAMVENAVLARAENVVRKPSATDRIDRILTHRVWGLVVFVALMYVVFQSIYSFAAPLMDLIDGAFGWISEQVSPLLSGNEILRSLVVDGLIAGVGSMLVFLPQILILFFFIAVLEGTGYLARAAFLMDRLLGWCGLNGRAFIPLLSSFACAIPGIMAARVMPDPKSRLATILVAPLMSCSARLPVYVLLIGAFIQPQFGTFWAGFALFAMHFLGLVVAIPIALVLNRRVIKGRRLPFMLELPPYMWPKWRDVWMTMMIRARVFVRVAGTIIVFMSFLIWGLSYFPRMGVAEREAEVARYSAQNPGITQEQIDGHMQEVQLAHSVLGRFGTAIEPAFVPLGFDWRITTSILAAFPAREVVVPSMGIMFSLGGDQDESSADLRNSMQNATWPDGRPLFTPWTAVGLMVFFALCAQCMATLATVRRETNSWKWAVFMFGYMTTLAYLGALAVRLLARAFGAE